MFDLYACPILPILLDSYYPRWVIKDVPNNTPSCAVHTDNYKARAGSDDLGGKDDFTTEVKTRIILPDHQSPPHSPIPDLVMDDGNL